MSFLNSNAWLYKMCRNFVLTIALLFLVDVRAFAQDFVEVPSLEPLERQIRDGSFFVGEKQVDASARRIAVVVGNSDYIHIEDLKNAVSDARTIAEFFREKGYFVLEGYNLDKRGIESLLRDAVVAGGPNAETVFFFAGHGVQVANGSYMIPVEAELADIYDLPFQTLNLDSLINNLGSASGTHLSFLDSCRNNPFEGVALAAKIEGVQAPILQGFAEPRAPSDTLIAYSTAPGEIAFDGAGSVSPYVDALLSASSIAPDADVETILTAVQQFLRDQTGGLQVPTWNSKLSMPYTISRSQIAPTVPLGSLPSSTPRTNTEDSANAEEQPLTIVAPRERAIALGIRMERLFNLSGDERIALPRSVAGGSFGLLSADGFIGEFSTDSISASQLPSLMLRLEGVEAQQVSLDTGVVTETLPIEITSAQSTRGYEIPITLVPNRCDIEAGDWFDPQGVGIFRLDAEIRPGQAISACEQALSAEPTSARFQFQLARGLQAAGRLGEAEQLFKSAAENGHVRAWFGAGNLFEQNGSLTQAVEAYEQGREGGDPIASISLGAIRLQDASDAEGRQAAYQILTEGVDLGLPEAMTVLAAYFADPSAPNFDADRGKRFEEEALVRGAAVAVAGAGLVALTTSQAGAALSGSLAGVGLGGAAVVAVPVAAGVVGVVAGALDNDSVTSTTGTQ